MADKQWFMAIGGHQIGPVGEQEIVNNIKNGSVDQQTLVFTDGMKEWTAIRDVPELKTHFGARVPEMPKTPAPGRRAHDIDFEIEGSEMQFVEVILDPGESAVAEAGTLMYMQQGIEMETIFGDGSAQQQTGIMGALLGAGKRLLTGESLAFAAPYAGKIIPLDLAKMGGQIICQKDSFLCAARGVSIQIAFQKKIG